MKELDSQTTLKKYYKKYEKFLNQQSANNKIKEKISEERLLTNYLIHDLSTPLSSAYAAFMILEQAPKYKVKREVLESGKESVESAVELLKSLKEVQTQKEKKTTFNIAESIEKVVRILHSKATKAKISLVFCSSHNMNIKSYEKTFQRVLMNILNNSIEELLECDKEKKFIQINLFLENEEIIISIKDSGNGIPQNLVNKLFSSGYSTKRNHSGLGLAYVYKSLKEKLEGHIQIISKEGVGTEVFLKLQGFCKNQDR